MQAVLRKILCIIYDDLLVTRLFFDNKFTWKKSINFKIYFTENSWVKTSQELKSAFSLFFGKAPIILFLSHSQPNQTKPHQTCPL